MDYQCSHGCQNLEVYVVDVEVCEILLDVNCNACCAWTLCICWKDKKKKSFNCNVFIIVLFLSKYFLNDIWYNKYTDKRMNKTNSKNKLEKKYAPALDNYDKVVLLGVI